MIDNCTNIYYIMSKTPISTPLIQESGDPSHDDDKFSRSTRAMAITFNMNRIDRLGPFSLMALFFGSLSLVLIATNFILGKDFTEISTGSGLDNSENKAWTLSLTDPLRRARSSRYAGSVPLQYWLIIVGFCISSTLYGLSNAWIHLFDAICTFRAQGRFFWKKKEGLDYGRYLNSLPNAPVMNGLRSGFWGMVIMKFGLILLGALFTAAYKLFFFGLPRDISGPFNGDAIHWTNPMSDLDKFGIFNPSPLFMDKKLVYGSTTAFMFGQWPAYLGMAAVPECRKTGVFDGTDYGEIHTFELIMMATKRNTSAPHYMTGRPKDLPLTSSHRLLVEDPAQMEGWGEILEATDGIENGPGSSSVIIEYSLHQEGWFEIEWTRYFDGWNCDRNPKIRCNDSNHQLLGYSAYDITIGTGHIQRSVSYGTCTEVTKTPTDMRSISKRIPYLDLTWFSSNNGLGPKHRIPEDFVHWIKTIATAPRASPDEVIAVLTKWALLLASRAATADNPWVPLGLLTPQNAKRVGYTPPPDIENPFNSMTFSGRKASMGTTLICYNWAIWVMMWIGITGLVIFCLRILLGPPEMTSWMAQHLYLASQSASSIGLDFDESMISESASDRYHQMYKPLKAEKYFVRWVEGPKLEYRRNPRATEYNSDS